MRAAIIIVMVLLAGCEGGGEQPFSNFWLLFFLSGLWLSVSTGIQKLCEAVEVCTDLMRRELKFLRGEELRTVEELLGGIREELLELSDIKTQVENIDSKVSYIEKQVENIDSTVDKIAKWDIP